MSMAKGPASSLVRVTSAVPKVLDLITKLAPYINVVLIPSKEGYSRLEGSTKCTNVLEMVRDEFKIDLNHSKKITEIVTAIILPSLEGTIYLTRAVRLYVFQGTVSLIGLVEKDDCVVLIPVVVSGSPEVIIKDPGTAQQTRIKLEVQSVCLIAGKCNIRVELQSKLVCVVLGIGKNKA